MFVSAKLFAAGACALSVLAAGTAAAQNYPNKPMRFLTTGIGASTDYATRVIAQGLKDNVGWNIVVENRGSTIVACDTVAKATADGYTLLVMTDGLWRGPLLQKMPFDPIKDFEPISVISRAPNILVVHPSLPVKTVKELIALAKAKPGELNYGAGAIGASTHLASEMFNLMADVKITSVPYKSSGQAVNALLGNQIQVMFGSSSGVTPHIKAGRLRALAVSTAAPSPSLPGLPTIADAGGLPGYESASTSAMFAPANTPKAIINQLNSEVLKALARPDVRERFTNLGVEVVGNSPQETAAFVKKDMANTARIIKAANITAVR